MRLPCGRGYIFTGVLRVVYVVLSGVGASTMLRMGVAIYLYRCSYVRNCCVGVGVAM